LTHHLEGAGVINGQFSITNNTGMGISSSTKNLIQQLLNASEAGKSELGAKI